MSAWDNLDELQSAESQLSDLGLASRQFVRLGYDPNKPDTSMSSVRGGKGATPWAAHTRPARTSTIDFDSPEAIRAAAKRLQERYMGQPGAGEPPSSTTPSPSAPAKDASAQAKPAKSVHFATAEENMGKSAVHQSSSFVAPSIASKENGQQQSIPVDSAKTQGSSLPDRFAASQGGIIEQRSAAPQAGIAKDRPAPSQSIQTSIRNANARAEKRRDSVVSGSSRSSFLGRLNDQLQGAPRVFVGNAQPNVASTTERHEQSNGHDIKSFEVLRDKSNSKSTQQSTVTDAAVTRHARVISSDVLADTPDSKNSTPSSDALNKHSKSLEDEHEVLGRLTHRKLDELKLLIEMFEEVDARLVNRATRHFVWDDQVLEKLKEYYSQPLTSIFESLSIRSDKQSPSGRAVAAAPPRLRADLMDLDTSDEKYFEYCTTPVVAPAETVVAQAEPVAASTEPKVQTPNLAFQTSLPGSAGDKPQKPNTPSYDSLAGFAGNKVQNGNSAPNGKPAVETIQIESPQLPTDQKSGPTTHPKTGIWQKEKEANGQIFYWHTDSKEASWRKPSSWSIIEERVSYQPWRVRRTEHPGRVCYLNIATNMTTWDMPEELRRALGEQAKDFTRRAD